MQIREIEIWHGTQIPGANVSGGGSTPQYQSGEAKPFEFRQAQGQASGYCDRTCIHDLASEKGDDVSQLSKLNYARTVKTCPKCLVSRKKISMSALQGFQPDRLRYVAETFRGDQSI